MNPEQREWRPFLWQSGLLLLPVLILAAVGLYLLRQDKFLVEREARERAEHLSAAAFAWLQTAVRNQDFSAYTNFTEAWPAGSLFFQVDESMDLIFPPPIAKAPAFSLATLDPEAQAVWQNAEQREFGSGDLAGALELWKELLQSEVPPGARAVAEFNRAVLLQKLGHSEEASQAFLGLRDAPLDARTEAGFPVRHLAAANFIELALPEEQAELIAQFGRQLLQEPTPASPVLLAGAQASLAGGEALAAPARLWEQHEQARYLYQYGRGLMRNQGADQFENFHAADAHNQWYGVTWQGTNVFAGTAPVLGKLFESRSPLPGQEIPSYLRVELLWSGNRISGEPPRGGTGELLAESESGGAEARVYLSDAGALFALQRQRARWIGGIIALSAIAAFVGVANNYRTHLRQRRLQELKSNFVSSVSHELRAPLASMRLLSEGLQSGRVEGPEKQREYYDYLVQECRRLSVLVENVLDFSRIEQGRKSYDFQECSLLKIAEAAIRSVEPIARDRRVQLLLECSEEAELVAEVDSMALQQALINLLDNAIKHSPEDAPVITQISRREGRIELAVTDRGPGIDPAEQHRIFERFYRLGSELRRETPGVGIGLSIVQHTVEAHGGSVRVESGEENRGSRFIIELPAAQQGRVA